MTIGSNASVLVDQQLPDFINTQDSMFRIFMQAYYEYLELRRDSETANVKELFKKISSPNALISDASINRDIDSTLNAFVQYFYDQVIPVALDATRVDYRFGVKKIRDMYLAKGTPNSFKLFFRMLFSEEIDVIFPRDSILAASNGKFLSFAQVRAVVTEGQSLLANFNFQLSTLYNDSDGIDKGILVVDGYSLSSIGNNTVVNLILNSGDVDLDFTRTFILQDTTNPSNYIRLRILVQLDMATPINSAPGYILNDVIRVYDPSLNVNLNPPVIGVATLRVSSVASGRVDYIQLRDRGEAYQVGDSFTFAASSSAQGSGGSAAISDVDYNGRILAIGGVMARTGPMHNGYLTDDFVNANIPIAEGGFYREFPRLTVKRNEIDPSTNPTDAARYNQLGGLTRQDAQTFIVSDTIGQAQGLTVADPGFFNVGADLKVLAPFHLITAGNTNFPLGAVLEFQYFNADSEAFEPDSEILDINITFKSNRAWSKTLPVPLRFANDSENDLFVWINASVDVRYSGDQIAVINAISQAVLPDYRHIAPPDNLTPWKIDDRRLYPLDAYHFNQLNTRYNPNYRTGFRYEDSDIRISYTREYQNPRIRLNTQNEPIMPGTGAFVPTGLGGRVIRRNDLGTQYTIDVYPSLLQFPTDSELKVLDEIPYSILRVVQVNPITGDQITENEFPLTDYVVQWNGDIDLQIKLSGPIYTSKRFVNEDGFLDSTSGSVLRDNYFYSDSTYVLQSTHALQEWGAKVKQLLHPAGTILIADLIINTSIDAPTIRGVAVEGDVDNGFMYMDSALDSYIPDEINYGTITADSTAQATDPFLVYNRLNANGMYLFSDNFIKEIQTSITSQYGNAMWDYEPVGLVNGSTTQRYDAADSDGQGNYFVMGEDVYYQLFDTNLSDFYKELAIGKTIIDTYPITLYRTHFTDNVNEKYTAYNIVDSERYRLLFTTAFNDSERVALSFFRRVDYSQVHDSDFIRKGGRNYIRVAEGAERNSDIRLSQNRDLQRAMRLDKSLSFRDGGVTYYDFEAYEVKWNRINSRRTINTEGWQIPGYTSVLQNIIDDSDYWFLRIQLANQSQYTTVKTPLNQASFNWGDPTGNVIWNNYYLPQINRRIYQSPDSETYSYSFRPYVYGDNNGNSLPDPRDLANASKRIP